MNAPELFYVSPQDVCHEFLILRKDEYHHLIHVLRKKEGDSFWAVDGKGTIYECQIEETNQGALKSRIYNKQFILGEPVFKLALALATPQKTVLNGLWKKVQKLEFLNSYPY